MAKKSIETIFQKNTIVNNIINAISTMENFLILGHKNPDDDCVASTVSMALILTKFSKNVYIYYGYPVHDHYNYLMNICRYNSITIVERNETVAQTPDAVIICDTPKPSMVDTNRMIDEYISNPEIIKIELDHHLGADSDYNGDPDYSFVLEASSASELVGYLALKMRNNKDLMKQYQIKNLMTRNFVLAVLTGIIGDSKMGSFLKSKRELRYYDIFSRLYNSILSRETIKKTNLANMNEVFTEIQKLSTSEEKCANYMMKKKKLTSHFGYIIMDQDDMKYLYKEFDDDTIVSITRGIADRMAEESKKFGFVSYFENDEKSDLIQFRIRRSKSFKDYDLRNVLKIFNIENGGGHEGAIGFRLSRSKVENVEAFVQDIIVKVEGLMK
ncbi:MAG: hypothetical protein CVV44_23190 [Spirochaetae bacterium HGW-Spirochaetae-1]|jgi:nanoRNase/pAp phosphatase (c-di-AMP/oligoRNAs hydrolase)|nr:MAG: hypothetical protein CVV44_23190 [Spirochaetae bacterium HGW-Spirochaetae-1]